MEENISVPSSHRFISFDKTPIYYKKIKASADKKAIVIIVHGMGEHGARYVAFAEYLAVLGMECYLPDLRGFGNSGGKRAGAKRFSEFHRDLEALHDFIRRNSGQTPIFILGHSFGGLVSASYLALNKGSSVQGLILTSPIFGIAIPVPKWRHILGKLVSYVYPGYSQPTQVTPEFLTHDKEILREYAKDNLIYHRICASLYRELQGMISKRDLIAQKLKLPILVLQAGEDRIVSKEAALRFYDNLGSLDKDLEVYEGFYHEILNEINRPKVYSRISLWLLNHLVHK